MARAAVSLSSAPASPLLLLERIGQVWKAWRNRREFYRLGEMTDSELADIGLTRADLSVVVGLPLGSDPTAHLGALATARIRSVEDSARLIA